MDYPPMEIQNTKEWPKRIVEWQDREVEGTGYALCKAGVG